MAGTAPHVTLGGMMMKAINSATLIVLMTLWSSSTCSGATQWVEGQQYFLIVPSQPTSVPRGKVEVTEVFSYGCPACNEFVPVMHRLRASLPANAIISYLPASFNPSEDWPMLQRAYITAQVLGVADRAHDAVFKAIWNTGELAIIDPNTRRIKDRLPTIEDAGKFYNRTTGVSVQQFIDTAKSFSVDTRMRQADEMLMRYRVSSTPTIIVNGKYRLEAGSAGGYNELIELVKWLVAKESI
jgi:thiol:disulfide interchange protein DsbA